LLFSMLPCYFVQQVQYFSFHGTIHNLFTTFVLIRCV
jgi:hypothetical protein